MKARFITFVVLVATVTVLFLVIRYPAELTVEGDDFKYTGSVYFFVLAIFALALMASVFWKLISSLLSLPAVLKKIFSHRKQKKGEQNLAKGLQLYLEGNYSYAAQALADYAQTAPKVHKIVYLLAADAALLDNNGQSARKFSMLASQVPQASTAAEMIAADIAINYENPESVASRINDLMAVRPNNLRMLRALIKLCEKSNAWHLAEPALWQLDRVLQDTPHRREQIRIKIISASLRKAVAQKDAQQFNRLWETAVDNHLEDTLLEEYIPLLVEISGIKEAERYLEKMIETTSSEHALQQYGKLTDGDSKHRIEKAHKWRKRHPSDSTLLWCIARLYRADGQPQQAKEYFEKSLAIQPNYQAWHELEELRRGQSLRQSNLGGP